MITQSQAKKFFDYNPATGEIRWRVPTSRRVKIGQIAGSLQGDGHKSIRLDGKIYGVHRIAWVYMTGDWPTSMIDHKDQDPSNNRFENLRIATKSQNAANSKAHADSKSKFKGVSYYHHRKKPYMAKICKNYKQIFLGWYHTPEEAYAAYCRAAVDLFGEYASI